MFADLVPVHEEKSEVEQQKARLLNSQRYTRFGLEACSLMTTIASSKISDSDDGVAILNVNDKLDQLLQLIEEKLRNPGLSEVKGPPALPPIAPQLTVNLTTATNQNLSKLVPLDLSAIEVPDGSPQGKPWFVQASRKRHPVLQRFVQQFRTVVASLVETVVPLATEKLEGGRMALANVNLPHSLKAYTQYVAGGGLPDELWERVDSFQRTERLLVGWMDASQDLCGSSSFYLLLPSCLRML
jgi:hypothetical protein